MIRPEIAFAFKCASCGEAKVHVYDVFRLSGSKLCLCDCMNGCMHLEFMDGIAAASFLCPYCGGVHTYRLTATELMYDNLSELVCAETELVCAYAGAPDRVEREVRRYHTAMDALLEELSAQPDAVLAGKDREEIDRMLLQTNAGIRREAGLVLTGLTTVEELLYAQRITCPCGSKSFELAFLGGYIQVQCGDCGAYVRLSAKNDADLQKIQASNEIILTK